MDEDSYINEVMNRSFSQNVEQRHVRLKNCKKGNSIVVGFEGFGSKETVSGLPYEPSSSIAISE